jgi:signal transduction histidine kinase
MSQRARLLLIVALAVLPLAAFSALEIWQELREGERQIAEERVQLARAFAVAVEAFIDGHLSTLRSVVLHPAVTAARPSHELDALVKRVVADNPQWGGLGIYAIDGRSLAGTRGAGGLFIGDRPFFREALATGQPVVGNAVIGRINGKVTVVLAVPFSKPDGELAGVAAVPLPTDRFRSGLTLKLGRAPAHLTVIDREGQVFIGAEAELQEKLARLRGPEVTSVLAGETGSAVVARAGGPTLAAYAPVADFGFGAIVSEPAGSAFAAPRREALQRAVVLAAIVLIVGGLAWGFGGRVTKLYQRALDARGEAERLAGELRHALTTRDDFLASAAHDLRNPLSAIRGGADLVQRMLERGDAPRERLAASVAHIQSAARRIGGMLDAFLDLAQLQLGRPLELRKELQDVAALAREVVAQAQQASARHRLRLAAPAELMAVVDGPRLQRVMDNLVANAVKYSPEGGEVAVELCDEGAELVLSVRDRGIGIPPSEIEAVFERFRRGSNVAGRFVGTGIGLAGARQIVEQHGGSVEVTSALGSGSTFTVRLPTGRP